MPAEPAVGGAAVSVLRFSQPVRLLLLIGAPMLGAVIGGFLPRLARWAGELPWVPFQDPLNALASLTGWWVPVAGALLGVTAGIWLAYVAFKESLAVTVDNQNVRLRRATPTATPSDAGCPTPPTCPLPSTPCCEPENERSRTATTRTPPTSVARSRSSATSSAPSTTASTGDPR